MRLGGIKFQSGQNYIPLVICILGAMVPIIDFPNVENTTAKVHGHVVCCSW
jgi:hypothetical protein